MIYGIFRVFSSSRCLYYAIPFRLLLLSISAFLMTLLVGASSVLEYRFREEQPLGTPIGNVRWDSGLSTKYSPQQMPLLRLNLRRTSPDGSYRYFTVNDTTGMLRSSQAIDREAVCPYFATCLLRLDVVVSPAEFFHIIKVVVVVEDINDQTPTFDPDGVSLEISEGARVGSVLALPSAVDADSSVYGIQRYELVPPAGPFELKVNEHRDGTTAIQLRLTERLDRETVDSYVLLVMAIDGGNPPNEGQLTVNISVADVNDNIPRFDSLAYQANVSEDEPLGSLILRVRATDPDSGRNGDVSYGFAVYTDPLHLELFEIENATGEIRTKASLHHKLPGDLFHLTVMAVDGGPNRVPAFARVTVRVLDTNDNWPQMTVSTMTPSGQAEVREDVPVGAFIAHILVTDEDRNESGRVTCDVSPSSNFFLESRFEKEYTLTAARRFDRETETEDLVASLTCRDYGTPSLVSTISVPVKVTDVNDHAPRIQPHFKVSVPENNAIGMVLIQLNATDDDADKNAELTYELDPADGNGGSGKEGATSTGDLSAIAVDPQTGEVRANVVFNFEWRRIYAQRIVVRDGGDPPFSATTTLTVEVLDLNDEPPTFSRTTYHFQVTENLVADTLVGTVTADDADINQEYRVIKYSMRGGDGSFSIDTATGEIRTLRPFDREVQAVYRVTVSATNDAFPSMKTSANVIVRIVDENDNSPVVVFPSGSDPVLEIPCRTPSGSAVTRIEAVDPDDGPGGVLSYDLAANNDFTQLFRIDPQTGIVSIFYPNPSFHECRTYSLTIRVTDSGSPARATVKDLRVLLNDTLQPPIRSEPPRPRDVSASSGGSSVSGSSSDDSTYVILFPTLLLGSFLVVMAVVLATVLCLYRRRRKNKKKKRQQTETEKKNRSRSRDLEMMDPEDERRLSHRSNSYRTSINTIHRLMAESKYDTRNGSAKYDKRNSPDVVSECSESDSGCSASEESDKRTST